jgi:hypothetical protein
MTAGGGVRNIIPRFKAGSYYNGLTGTDALIDVFKRYKAKSQNQSKGFPILPIIIIVIIT